MTEAEKYQKSMYKGPKAVSLPPLCTCVFFRCGNRAEVGGQRPERIGVVGSKAVADTRDDQPVMRLLVPTSLH